MITLGIDIGSNTIKAVILKDAKDILWSCVQKTTHDIEKVTSAIIQICLKNAGISLNQCERIVATGYGRVTCKIANKNLSEITCHAKGAFFYFKKARTVIDIGGQDSKVISLSDNGKVIDFIMNDKCAAGTGRFLEVMAQILGISLTDFAIISKDSTNPVHISNICTVFAESEVIGLIAQKQSKENIVAGLNQSVAARVVTLASRIKLVDDIIFTGGVALNGGVKRAIEKISSKTLFVPPNPEITGALGAALLAVE